MAKSETDSAQVAKLLAGTRGGGRVRRLREARAQTRRLARAGARALTQGDGRERRRARRLALPLDSDVLEADETFEQSGAKLVAEADELGEAAAAEAEATASPGSRFIIVIALLAIAAAAALATWVTRSVVRPVKALGERMTTLDEQDLSELSVALGKVAEGDLTYGVAPVTTPIEVNSTDEIGRLAATFNGMLDKARHSIESYGGDAGRAERRAWPRSRRERARSRRLRRRWRRPPRRPAAPSARSPPRSRDVATGAERQVRMVESTRGAVQEAARAAGVSADTGVRSRPRPPSRRAAWADEGVKAAAQATSAIREVERFQRPGQGPRSSGLAAKSAQIGGIVENDHRDRRADQPARLECRDRGRACR